MSFGLKISFGRLVKKVEIPPFEIIRHDDSDYFSVIYKDGRSSNEVETDDWIFGKTDLGYHMINKKALERVKIS